MKEADFDALVQEYQAQVDKTKSEIEKMAGQKIDLPISAPASFVSEIITEKGFHPWLLNVGICVYICDYLIKSGNLTDWKWWALMVFVAYMTQVFRYDGKKNKFKKAK
jgi:hypothetical protein